MKRRCLLATPVAAVRSFSSVTALAVVLALGACVEPPPVAVVVEEGICWPAEPNDAYAEYQRNCGADGAQCPATTRYRAQLAIVKKLINRPCVPPQLADPTENPNEAS
jgi:hypothetical protein